MNQTVAKMSKRKTNETTYVLRTRCVYCLDEVPVTDIEEHEKYCRMAYHSRGFPDKD